MKFFDMATISHFNGFISHREIIIVIIIDVLILCHKQSLAERNYTSMNNLFVKHQTISPSNKFNNIFKTTHETSLQSLIYPLYNSFSKSNLQNDAGTERYQHNYLQKQNDELYHQSPSIGADNYTKRVALGAEGQYPLGVESQKQQQQQQQQQFGAQTSDPLLPIIIADDSSNGENMIIQPTSMINRGLDPSASRPQVLASLYIDQFGNQHLGLPNESQHYPSQQHTPTPGQAGSQIEQVYAQETAKNFYDTQQSSQPQPAAIFGGINPLQNQLYNNQYDQPQLIAVDMPHQNQQSMYKPGHNLVNEQQQEKSQIPTLASSLAFPQNSESKTLSNEQLLSLIDELKEYNSKQSPVAESVDNEESESLQDEDDNDSDPSSIKTKHAAKETHKPIVEHNKRESKPKLKQQQAEKSTNEIAKPSTDDLARFAKFLMTKEGANMRFQLGLEKDSPDDGDEEERDTLLESKTKQRKTKKPQVVKGESKEAKDLIDLDYKHTQVAEQMDKLLEHLTGTLNEVEKKPNKIRKKVKSQSDEDLRARARRNSGENRVTSGNTKTEIIIDKAPLANDGLMLEKYGKAKFERGHKNNFAKQLINQELDQDKNESTKKDNINTKKTDDNDEEKSTTTREITMPRRQKSRRESGLDIIEVSGGVEENRYPISDRKKDHMGLLKKLKNTRTVRANSRSRKPILENPVMHHALAEKLGIKTEHQPDGTLKLSSGLTGSSINLKLIKNDGSRENNSDIDSYKSNKDGNVLNHVRIDSDNSVKDEYPVSEKVNNRLNELSQNLDRYFNDGFLKEVDERSVPKQENQAESRQVETPNVERKKNLNDERNATKVDHDFDMNVGIDGKRDVTDREDPDDSDGEEEEEDNTDGDANDKNDETVVKDRAKNYSEGKQQVNQSKKKEKRNKRIFQNRGGQNKRRAKKLKKDGELVSGSVKQDMSAANEHLTFESRVNPGEYKRKSLDPVESESFDSPIGPDENVREQLKIPRAAKRKLESSSESRQVATKFGKKMPNKFFEEPNW